MRQRAVDAPRMNRLWTWKDSSIIVHFYELHLWRAKKYGLDIPIQTWAGLTQDDLK